MKLQELYTNMYQFLRLSLFVISLFGSLVRSTATLLFLSFIFNIVNCCVIVQFVKPSCYRADDVSGILTKYILS